MLCFQRDGRVRPEDFMVSKALRPLGKAHCESLPERAKGHLEEQYTITKIKH